MDKAKLKAYIAEAKQTALVKAIEVDGLAFYVKRYTVGEMNKIAETTDKIQEMYSNDKDTLALRLFALDAYDENGNPCFDYTSDDDVELIRDLPVNIRIAITSKANEINGLGKLL